MMFSRKALQRILGILWLIDGLLQLQPQMFTMNMVSSIMKPILTGQPAFFQPSLQFIITQTALHLIAVNLLIAVVQICLGLGFLLLPERWIKELVIASFIWALIVWFAGEGLSMLLTGTSSILSGSPGAVLLYPLLGLVAWPHKRPVATSQEVLPLTHDNGLLSRKGLCRVLSGFWFFAALLQMQPYWWQPGQISGTISAMTGQGGLNSVLVDPVLIQLSHATTTIETPLNITLIAVFLLIGIGLAAPGDWHLPPFLIASIMVSILLWYSAEAFGLILTGMATDFNSGLLLIVITLACWPRRIKQAESVRAHHTHHVQEISLEDQMEDSGSVRHA